MKGALSLLMGALIFGFIAATGSGEPVRSGPDATVIKVQLHIGEQTGSITVKNIGDEAWIESHLYGKALTRRALTQDDFSFLVRRIEQIGTETVDPGLCYRARVDISMWRTAKSRVTKQTCLTVESKIRTQVISLLNLLVVSL